MTLKVHHLQVSQSERIPWLCEELGIPYELILHQRAPVLSPPEVKKLTAMGAAPVIEDTSPPYSAEQPLVLAESAAIIEYICNKYGDARFILPPSHKDYVTYLYWWHFSNDSLQATLSRQGSVLALDPKSENPFTQMLATRIPRILKHMDEHLAKNACLAGEEFTVADIMTLFSVSTMRKFIPLSLDGYDNVLAWMKRCGARPAYQKAMAKCDPDLGAVLEAESPPFFEALRAMAKV